MRASHGGIRKRVRSEEASATYELQDFYEDLPSELVSYFTRVDGTVDSPEIALKGLRRHVEGASRIGAALLEEHTEILGEGGAD